MRRRQEPCLGYRAACTRLPSRRLLAVQSRRTTSFPQERQSLDLPSSRLSFGSLRSSGLKHPSYAGASKSSLHFGTAQHSGKAINHGSLDGGCFVVLYTCSCTFFFSIELISCAPILVERSLTTRGLPAICCWVSLRLAQQFSSQSVDGELRTSYVEC